MNFSLLDELILENSYIHMYLENPMFYDTGESQFNSAGLLEMDQLIAQAFISFTFLLVLHTVYTPFHIPLLVIQYTPQVRFSP